MSTDQKAFTAYSTLTCSECGHQTKAMMSTESCQFFYEYPGSNAMLWPKVGDFVVFCSLGDVPCPPIQQDRAAADRSLIGERRLSSRVGFREVMKDYSLRPIIP